MVFQDLGKHSYFRDKKKFKNTYMSSTPEEELIPFTAEINAALSKNQFLKNEQCNFFRRAIVCGGKYRRQTLKAVCDRLDPGNKVECKILIAK